MKFKIFIPIKTIKIMLVCKKSINHRIIYIINKIISYKYAPALEQNNMIILSIDIFIKMNNNFNIFYVV